MANEGALAKLDDDAAIERIANGAILKEFAQEFGCSVVAVHKRLKKHPEYQDAVNVATHNQVQVTTKALMECDSAPDAVNLARARARHALDIAKVRNPDYADKKDQSGGGIRIIINDGSSAGVTIEHEQAVDNSAAALQHKQ